MLNYKGHFPDVLDEFADCGCFDVEVLFIRSAVAVGDGPVAEKLGVECEEFGGRGGIVVGENVLQGIQIICQEFCEIRQLGKSQITQTSNVTIKR